MWTLLGHVTGWPTMCCQSMATVMRRIAITRQGTDAAEAQRWCGGASHGDETDEEAV